MAPEATAHLPAAPRPTLPARSRFMLMFLAAATLAASLWLHWRLRSMAYDDAYIHLRIVRNLLGTGHAWFNPGERVMATSSPLWTALLALLQMARWPWGLPLLEGVLLWAAVWTAAALAWCSFAATRTAVRATVAGASGVATFLLLVSASIGQMETPLALLLLLGAWRAAMDRRGVALPLLAAAAVTRLEWLPLFFAAAALWWLGTRRWRPVLAGCGVVALAAAATVQQFGVLLPNSMRAKQIGYGFSLLRSFHEWVNPRLRDELLLLLLLAAVSWCAWDTLQGWRAGKAGPPQWTPLFAASGALVVGVEYVARHTVIFPWYRPLVLLPLLLGLLLYRPVLQSRSGGTALLSLHVVLFLTLLLPWLPPAAPILRAALSPSVAAESRVDGGDAARVQTYLQVGDALREECSSARVMAPEIGALGWAFGGYLYDGFGLASPRAMHYQPLVSAPLGGLPVGFVHEVQPDVIVSYTVLDEEPRHDPQVLATYRLFALPTSARGVRGGALDRGWRSSPHLNVWVKRDGACNAEALAPALAQRF